MPNRTNIASRLARLFQCLFYLSNRSVQAGPFITVIVFPHLHTIASGSRCFHALWSIGSTRGPLSLAEYVHTFFRFLQLIPHFGLHLGNENRGSGTFRLGMQHIRTRTHGTGCAVLNQFSWTLQGRCASTCKRALLFLETISLIEPLIQRKICPQNPVFWLSFSRYGFFFWEKNFKTIFGTPFPIEKVTCAPFPQKWSCPQKLFFTVILENIVSCIKRLFL